MRSRATPLAASLAACLLLAACGRAADEGTGADHSGAACVGALIVDGAWYVTDPFNDGRIGAEALGGRVGEVERLLPCEATEPGDVTEGIWALGAPVGSEVRSVPEVDAAEMLAVVTIDGVQVFRAAETDLLDTVSGADISSIGINSGHDGTTSFATIGDDDLLAALLADLDAARPADVEADAVGDDPDYFIELARADGLVTVVPYWSSTRRLDDRAVGAIWSTAIDAALAGSEDQPEVGDLRLTGATGTASFHVVGACRHDRPNLDVVPGEELQASHDPALDVRWWLNPPEPDGDVADATSQVGSKLIVPSFDGTMIVEGVLTDADGVVVADLCTTLRAAG